MDVEPGIPEHATAYNITNGSKEADRNFIGNLLPRLIPKLLDVFQDPSVIREITQHELNKRPDSNLDFMQMSLGRNEQHLHQLILNDPLNLEVERLLQKYSRENNETEAYKSFTSITSQRTNVNKGIRAESTEYLKNKRRPYACIKAAVFLLAIILAGSLTIFIVWLAVNSGGNLALDQLFNTCSGILDVSVKSLDEYNAAFEIGGNQKLSIDIDLDRPSDWPTGIQVKSSDNMNDIRISGPFHTKKLTGLLGTISKLEKLHLDNRDNLMCIESTPPIKTFDSKENVDIHLNQLTLEGFNELCKRALSICLGMDFHDLETFRYVSGLINAENVNIIEMLLEKYRSTLKKLEIIKSSLSTEIFSDIHHLTFPNVHEVVFDTIQDDENGVFVPLHKICTIFPNVERLSFGSGLTKWKDVKNVYNCKKLRSLEINIWVKSINDNISLAFLSERFPNLEGAEIKFLFSDSFPGPKARCSQEILKIDGKNDLSKLLLANLRITSNCRLKF